MIELFIDFPVFDLFFDTDKLFVLAVVFYFYSQFTLYI